MEPTLDFTLGDEHFTFVGITVQEMSRVKSMTGLKKRQDLFTEIIAEDPDALIAAYVIAKARKGETVRVSDANFNLDALDVTLTDGAGREVEPVVQKTKDGKPKLDKDGKPIPVLDAKGAQEWVYTDTGEPVPPTEAAATKT